MPPASNLHRKADWCVKPKGYNRIPAHVTFWERYRQGIDERL